MPRHKNAKRDQVLLETRQLLLDAAAEEFAHKGFDGANVNQVSRAAGFAKGTIYNYFASKRVLLEELVDEIAARHVDYMHEQVMEVDEPRRRLERFFDAGFAFVRDHLTQARVIFNAINGPDMVLRARIFQTYQPLFQLVGDSIVGEGIAHGEFRNTDPVMMAGLLMNIYLGTGSQIDEHGQQWLPADYVADFAYRALLKTETRTS